MSLNNVGYLFQNEKVTENRFRTLIGFKNHCINMRPSLRNTHPLYFENDLVLCKYYKIKCNEKSYVEKTLPSKSENFK